MKETIQKIIKKWLTTCSLLFKIMIPVSIIVKVLQETNLLPIIGDWLSPLMSLIGLPGQMSIVWVSSMCTNLYGGILALSSIYADNPLNVAQMTILCSLMLFCHAFFIEIPVCKKAGVGVLPIFLIRFVGGYLFCVLLNLGYSLFPDLHTQEVVFPSIISNQETTLWAWALGEIQNYITIASVILLLIVVLEVLERLKVIDLVNLIFLPFVKLLGISPKVMPLTIVGMTLGLGYGGGLIIAESREKKIDKKDIFLSLSLLSMYHSIIEDALLMIGLGAWWVAIVVIRFVYTILIMLVLKKIASLVYKPKECLE